MDKRDAVPGLGEQLKAARSVAGLNQMQAAGSSGVSQGNISKFEADTKTPTLATLYKLAAAYGVNVCDLLPGGDLGGAAGRPTEEEEEEEPPAKTEKKPKGKKS